MSSPLLTLGGVCVQIVQHRACNQVEKSAFIGQALFCNTALSSRRQSSKEETSGELRSKEVEKSPSNIHYKIVVVYTEERKKSPNAYMSTSPPYIPT